MYIRWLKFLTLTLLAISCCSACTSTGDVLLDETGSGTTVTLDAGQTLVIRLPSNPTTGYSWEVDAIDEPVLAQVGQQEYTPDSGSEGLAGAGGTETFRFEAQASGSTVLRLIYHRPFEEGVEPINTFTVTVEVR